MSIKIALQLNNLILANYANEHNIPFENNTESRIGARVVIVYNDNISTNKHSFTVDLNKVMIMDSSIILHNDDFIPTQLDGGTDLIYSIKVIGFTLDNNLVNGFDNNNVNITLDTNTMSGRFDNYHKNMQPENLILKYNYQVGKYTFNNYYQSNNNKNYNVTANNNSENTNNNSTLNKNMLYGFVFGLFGLFIVLLVILNLSKSTNAIFIIVTKIIGVSFSLSLGLLIYKLI